MNYRTNEPVLAEATGKKKSRSSSLYGDDRGGTVPPLALEQPPVTLQVLLRGVAGVAHEADHEKDAEHDEDSEHDGHDGDEGRT